MADMSPLFESVSDSSQQLIVRLDREKLTINSRNHNRSGQNVLFGDGRVEFYKTRNVSYTQDDIYTLKDTDIYKGSETPSSETDFFLAP